MIDVELPMWRADRMQIGLHDVLASLPGENFSWTVLHLEAIGHTHDGSSMSELKTRARMSRCGIQMPWHSLLELSKRITQTINCVIVGATILSKETCTEIRRGRYTATLFVVCGQDGAYWKVSVNAGLQHSDTIIAQLNKLAGTRT